MIVEFVVCLLMKREGKVDTTRSLSLVIAVVIVVTRNYRYQSFNSELPTGRIDEIDSSSRFFGFRTLISTSIGSIVESVNIHIDVVFGSLRLSAVCHSSAWRWWWREPSRGACGYCD
jgi:hypothetical protein